MSSSYSGSASRGKSSRSNTGESDTQSVSSIIPANCGYHQFHSRPKDSFRFPGVRCAEVCDFNIPVLTCKTYQNVNVFRCCYASDCCKFSLPVEGTSLCCYVKHNYDGPGCCVYSKHITGPNISPFDDCDCGPDMTIEGCLQVCILPLPTFVGMRYVECFVPCCPYFTCTRKCMQRADCCGTNLVRDKDNHFPEELLIATRTDETTCWLCTLC